MVIVIYIKTAVLLAEVLLLMLLFQNGGGGEWGGKAFYWVAAGPPTAPPLDNKVLTHQMDDAAKIWFSAGKGEIIDQYVFHPEYDVLTLNKTFG